MNRVKAEVDKALDNLELHFPTHAITYSGLEACTVGNSFVIIQDVLDIHKWVVELWPSKPVSYDEETMLSGYGPSKRIASCLRLRDAVAIAVGRVVEEYLSSEEYSTLDERIPEFEPEVLELSEDREIAL